MKLKSKSQVSARHRVVHCQYEQSRLIRNGDGGLAGELSRFAILLSVMLMILRHLNANTTARTALRNEQLVVVQFFIANSKFSNSFLQQPSDRWVYNKCL